MSPVVLAEGVERRYGDTVAVDGVSLSIEQGEVYGLVGPNGAGKTTLLRALTGTTDAEGQVSLFGADPRAIDRNRLGLLPQEFSPPGRLTAREIVAYYRGLYDAGRAPADVLADVGLEGAADTWYERLSGGQKRRVCVAIAIVNEPELLVLDEPTTGIDPAGRRALWALIDRLAAAGTTIVLTTHYMAEAERLCDRVGLLAEGRLAAEDSPAALVSAHGGEPSLAIETADPAAVDALATAGYQVSDRRDVVVEGLAARDVGEVAATLDRAAVDYGELVWRQPDLETVYLEITGRRLVRTPADGLGTEDGEPRRAARGGRSR
jgi:ABC-2 type transport system ATP-binding protein